MILFQPEAVFPMECIEKFEDENFMDDKVIVKSTKFAFLKNYSSWVASIFIYFNMIEGS